MSGEGLLCEGDLRLTIRERKQSESDGCCDCTVEHVDDEEVRQCGAWWSGRARRCGFQDAVLFVSPQQKNARPEKVIRGVRLLWNISVGELIKGKGRIASLVASGS